MRKLIKTVILILGLIPKIPRILLGFDLAEISINLGDKRWGKDFPQYPFDCRNGKTTDTIMSLVYARISFSKW